LFPRLQDHGRASRCLEPERHARTPKWVAAGGVPLGVEALVVDSCCAVGGTAQALGKALQGHRSHQEVERHGAFGNAILNALLGGFEVHRTLVVPHRPWEHHAPEPDEIPTLVVDQDQRGRDAHVLRLTESRTKRPPLLPRVGVAAAGEPRIHEA